MASPSNIIAGDVSQFDFKYVSGLQSVSCANDGSQYGISESGAIYHKEVGDQWKRIEGTGKWISAGSSEHVWMVDLEGHVHQLNVADMTWKRVGGDVKLTQISVGHDGACFGVNSDSNLCIYHPKTDAFLIAETPAKAVQVSCGHRNQVWYVSTEGHLYEWNRESYGWTRRSKETKYRQVATGFDGSTWAVSETSSLYYYNEKEQSFTKMTGLKVARVTVGNTGQVFVSTVDSTIYQKVPGQQDKFIRNWHPFKHVLAGGVAGAVETLLLYPTEFVKTSLQLTPALYSGPLNCASQTVRTHGILGLYRGMSSLLLGAVPKSAVRFASFEQYKRMLQTPDGHMPGHRTFFAGMLAGVTEAVVAVCVMENLKTKFVHDMVQPKPRFRGLTHAIRTIVREDGVRGLYKGLGPTIIKQGTNQAVRFTCYNQLLSFMSPGKSRDDYTPLQTTFAGAFASGTSVLANNPIDVIKTRMQGLEAGRYRNAFHCAATILKDEGVSSFYKGVVPRMLRVVPNGAIVFTVYEHVMKLLNRFS